MIHAVAIHNYSAVGVLKYMPCMVTIRYTIRKFHMMCTVRFYYVLNLRPLKQLHVIFDLYRWPNKIIINHFEYLCRLSEDCLYCLQLVMSIHGHSCMFTAQLSLNLYAGSYSFNECCEKRMQVDPKLLRLVYLLMIGLILVGSLLYIMITVYFTMCI